ncbi:sugar transferase [Pseudooceanicola nanhaiensis]|jgi:exopolysaccharide production protein ExoY|uniref:sugar transferase n=1 Tax=Pseudooceanicola nanhaiensis TaxID=375761 RepID=UPI000A0278AC|nr:sugar transferase [Pseudooceanicola nanhaiensis]
MTFQLSDRTDRAGFIGSSFGVLVAERAALSRPHNPRAKAAFDKVLALLALPVLLPVGLIVALVLVIADGGPVLYFQRRVGRHGKTFRCWKFRTMVRDADAALERALKADPALRIEWLANRKLRNDPRIHRVGHFLRKSSLDEIPQLWNVLKGDMSFVGPRPVVADELHFYGPFAADYMSVRPGLTGAWQVSGRSNTTYDERVALDVDYVRNMTFANDLKIVAKTVKVVLAQTGAR